MTEITARVVDIHPQNEAALRAASRDLFTFLMGLHDEVGVGTPRPDKAMQGIYETLKDGAVIVALKGNKIVGSLGLYHTELWYADDSVLSELWFYITPEERDGPALQALLAELAKLCDELGAIAEIKINNPHRKRVPHTRLERIGAALSYQPSGGSYLMPPS
jgi:hypothetical protein